MNYKKTLYVQKEEKQLLFVHIGFVFLGSLSNGVVLIKSP